MILNIHGQRVQPAACTILENPSHKFVVVHLIQSMAFSVSPAFLLGSDSGTSERSLLQTTTTSSTLLLQEELFLLQGHLWNMCRNNGVQFSWVTGSRIFQHFVQRHYFHNTYTSLYVPELSGLQHTPDSMLLLYNLLLLRPISCILQPKFFILQYSDDMMVFILFNSTQFNLLCQKLLTSLIILK